MVVKIVYAFKGFSVHFAESMLCFALENLSRMLSLLTEPQINFKGSHSFMSVIVHEKDFTYSHCFNDHGTVTESCDKTATVDSRQFTFDYTFQSGSHNELAAAGFCQTLPVVAESRCDIISNKINNSNPKVVARSLDPAVTDKDIVFITAPTSQKCENT